MEEPHGKFLNSSSCSTNVNSHPGMAVVRPSSVPKNWLTMYIFNILYASSLSSVVIFLNVAYNTLAVGLFPLNILLSIESSGTLLLLAKPWGSCPIFNPLHKQNSSWPKRACEFPNPNHISSSLCPLGRIISLFKIL